METGVRFYGKDRSGDHGTYNPNTFSALDVAFAFLAFLALEFAAEKIFSAMIEPLLIKPDFDYYLYLLVGALIPQAIIFIVVFTISKIRRVSFLTGGGFISRFDSVNVLFGAMLAISLIILFSDLHFAFDDSVQRVFYGRSMAEYEELLRSRLKGNASYYVIFTFIVSPILPAIFEEAFCRGVIMRGLSQLGAGFAIIASAIFFTLMHGNLQQVVLQFLFGLAVGCTVMITKNFTVGCVMHLTYNLFVSVLEVIKSVLNELSEGAGYVAQMVTIIIGLAMFTVSVVYFLKLYLQSVKAKEKGLPPRTLIADVNVYALVSENGEDGYQRLCWREVGVGDNSLYGKFCNYKGKRFRLNCKSNTELSVVMLSLAALVAIVLLFVPI